jgi:hypothetical protein
MSASEGVRAVDKEKGIVEVEERERKMEWR